jgi:hypothetical protein
MIAVVKFESRTIVLVGQIVAFLTALNTFVTGYRAMLQPEIYFGPFEANPAFPPVLGSGAVDRVLKSFLIVYAEKTSSCIRRIVSPDGQDSMTINNETVSSSLRSMRD